MRLLLTIIATLVSSSAMAQGSVPYPVAIPEACVALAQREGVPRVLRNEHQAKVARAKLDQLNGSDPSVRECRQAVHRAMARYNQ